MSFKEKKTNNQTNIYSNIMLEKKGHRPLQKGSGPNIPSST